MDGDLNIIDAVERIRRYITERDPAADYRREELLSPAGKSPDKTSLILHYLAAVIGYKSFGASTRRNLLKLYRSLSSCETADSDFSVAEESVPGSFAEKLKKPALLRKGVTVLEQDFQKSGVRETLIGGGEKAASHLARRKIGLSGIKKYRFLYHIGAPVCLPLAPSMRLFFRLNWIPEVRITNDGFSRFELMCEKACRLAGENLRSLNDLLFCFTNPKSSFNGLSVCVRKPHCSECPLTHVCVYYKHRRVDEQNSIPSYPITDWAPDRRPREKLMKSGSGKLSDVELLAILLRTGDHSGSAVELAGKVMGSFGSFRRLEHATVKELSSISGIGPAKAVTLLAAIEIGKRFNMERMDTEGPSITGSDDVFQRYRLKFTGNKQETFVMLILDTRNRVVGDKTISKGSLSSCMVHPREVFKDAIRNSASAVIFMHNHPSGDPAPSRTDINLTSRLKKAGDILGIRVLDHIIIGEHEFYSFADHGHIGNS